MKTTQEKQTCREQHNAEPIQQAEELPEAVLDQVTGGSYAWAISGSHTSLPPIRT